MLALFLFVEISNDDQLHYYLPPIDYSQHTVYNSIYIHYFANICNRKVMKFNWELAER